VSYFRHKAAPFLLALLLGLLPSLAQAQSGKVIALKFTGSKKFTEEQIVAASGLKVGDTVSRAEIQAAADRLAQLGLFANVRFRFNSKGEDVEVEFQLEDAPTYPVGFDNFPWFSDEELIEAIRKDVPFFDGTAPEQGAVVDDILRALAKLLAANNIHGMVEVTLMAQPGADTMMQQFRLTGPALNVGAIEFTGPGAEIVKQDAGVNELIRSLLGKPYSRFGITVFGVEQVRPLFLNRGHLRVQIGKPVARFVGDPSKPLPDNVRVSVPVEPGPVYRWGGAAWSGNAAFGATALDQYLGFAEGDVVAGNRLTAAWERVRDEYSRRGHVDAKITPEAVFDDAAGRVSFRVAVEEGPVYRMGELIVTGLSLAAERKLATAWKIPRGEIFDRIYFENFLENTRNKKIFEEMVVHFSEVGHWLRTDPEKKIVDVLLDFK
jgi:outer membrane protein assembly factor BamA